MLLHGCGEGLLRGCGEGLRRGGGEGLLCECGEGLQCGEPSGEGAPPAVIALGSPLITIFFHRIVPPWRASDRRLLQH